jgi:deoxyribonuclease-1
MKMRQIVRITIIIALSLGFNCLAKSESSGTDDFDYVVTNLFWDDLYADGGWSFYCGYHFNHDRKTRDGKIIDVEHIYPIDRILSFVHCSSRLQCYENGNKKFRKMEADMHNLYPAWQLLITYRYEKTYGKVKSGKPRFNDCDIEWKAGVLEPRPIARGNIARAFFYMHDRYGLPLDRGILKILKQWNRTDPPSRQEKHRNDRIQALQGARNPYIDNPALADRITLTAK